ncbi:MAG TPA: hypothetical protein V6D29_13205 [Leptolyngbyaceae cyanobacterium]
MVIHIKVQDPDGSIKEKAEALAVKYGCVKGSRTSLADLVKKVVSGELPIMQKPEIEDAELIERVLSALVSAGRHADAISLIWILRDGFQISQEQLLSFLTVMAKPKLQYPEPDGLMFCCECESIWNPLIELNAGQECPVCKSRDIGGREFESDAERQELQSLYTWRDNQWQRFSIPD